MCLILVPFSVACSKCILLESNFLHSVYIGLQYIQHNTIPYNIQQDRPSRYWKLLKKYCSGINSILLIIVNLYIYIEYKFNNF